MKIIPKNKKVRLAKGLTSLEFACKCKNEFCRATIVSKDLIKAYGKFRALIGVALIVNSGFRCPFWNFQVDGKSCSYHQAGMAIDISLKSLDHLSISDIEFAAKECGFTFIKFYKTFVHMDVR